MGVSQFIAPTWLSVIKQHFPQVAQGHSDADILAMRADPALSQQATAAYAADNQAFLAKNGLPVTPGTTYLAHFAGPEGAAKILQADPNAPVSSILSPNAVKANPFLQNMTAQGLRAWAASKMGTTVPQSGVQTGGAPAPAIAPAPPGAPLSLAPPAAPIFAPRAYSAPPPLAQAPVPAAPPIFVPPRPHINLSGLQAALAARRAPIFPQQG